MNRKTLEIFGTAQLGIAFLMAVAHPVARADDFEVRINGITVPCPSNNPDLSELKAGTPGGPGVVHLDPFRCVASLAGYGTFLITGGIRADNFAFGPRSNNFNDALT